MNSNTILPPYKPSKTFLSSEALLNSPLATILQSRLDNLFDMIKIRILTLYELVVVKINNITFPKNIISNRTEKLRHKACIFFIFGEK